MNDAAGFVLAGGHSSRMGQDKALIQIGSLKLIELACTVLRAAGLDVSIAGARNPDLAAYAQVIPDAWPDAGPLGGICSALRSTDRQRAVFIPVDQPLLAPALLSRLLDGARQHDCAVTLASLRGEAQTFPAVVRCDALNFLEAELTAGRRGCMAAFRAAGLQTLPAEDVAGPSREDLAARWFLNVNTPQELAELRQGSREK